MCGRFCLFSSSKALSKDLGMLIDEPITPSHNISPGTNILTIRYDLDLKKRCYGLYLWGLNTPQNSHINARIETVDTAPRFRDAWIDRRCLIPANGFYEWYKDGLTKQPYYIFPKNLSPLYFGALYYPISDDQFQIVLITTQSTSCIRSIHDRMPLLISKDKHEDWLKGQVNKEDVYQNQETFELQSHTVSKRINSIMNNDASLINEIDPINDGQLRLF